jgi:hypothetical protein
VVVGDKIAGMSKTQHQTPRLKRKNCKGMKCSNLSLTWVLIVTFTIVSLHMKDILFSSNRQQYLCEAYSPFPTHWFPGHVCHVICPRVQEAAV